MRIPNFCSTFVPKLIIWIDMELSEQEQVRRQSLQTMREMGINPYPAAEYVVTGYSKDIKDGFVDDENPNVNDNIKTWHTGDKVSIAGRLMSKRVMGKASFIEIQDSKGRIQCYVSRDDIQLAEDAEVPAMDANDPNGNLSAETLRQMYNVVFKKLLDIGDFIGIEGFVFRTYPDGRDKCTRPETDRAEQVPPSAAYRQIQRRRRLRRF